MTRLYRTIILLPLLYCYHSLQAQDALIFAPKSPKRTIEARRISEKLHVDGRLDEAAWDSTSTESGFVQVEPYQGAAATQQTTIRVLYNNQFLYFGVFCRDSLGKKALRATDFKRDFDFRAHDLINISIDGFRDERNAMVFATNPYGVQRDLLAFDDVFYDVDWDGLWRVRTTRSDSGWVAEIAVPWQTFRYPKSADSLQTWGFNLYRNRRFTNEISTFSPFPRAYSATRMAYEGLLTGLTPPPPHANIRIQPYLLASFDRYRTPNTGEHHSGSDFKPGGDVKWVINTNTVLDLTANTDFAQADADRQVNNVTRFSVFFPERRQFFLENASLFGFNVGQAGDGSGGSMRIQPFFSRTIGLDDQGNPIPIDAGGRVVYRSNRQNFGAMAIRQRDFNETPATNFFVGRYSRNLGDQNRIGGMMTLKNRPDGTNIVSTVDGFFRIGEAQSINTFVVHTTGGQTDKQGFAGIAQYYNSTNNYKIWFTQSVVTKDFNPETGFVARKDIIGSTPGMNWYYRGKYMPFPKFVRALEPGFLPEFYWQASTGKLIESQLWFFPVWFNFQKGGYLGYGVIPSYEHLTEAFDPLGVHIPAGSYHFFRHSIWSATDPSKIVNMLGQFDWGTYFNGRLATLDLNVQFAPIPHISISGHLNSNFFRGVGDPVTDKTIHLYSIEGRFALNPRLQLIGFYQQNSENDSKNYNIRLAWEYQPLSFLYIVLNKSGFRDDLHVRQIEDHAIIKLSFLKQI